jgi:hypothetical protein
LAILATAIMRDGSLREDPNVFNWGGYQEKWFRTDSAWYFVTPDGSLYHWVGTTDEFMNGGVQIMTFDSSYYENPNLIIERLHALAVNDLWLMDDVFKDFEVLLV